jgi:glycosyltransferase involved in cell wall biosynthesis
MNILFLYGATLSDLWGRSQNLALGLARAGHRIDYLDCIRPIGKPAAEPPRDLPPGIRWHRAAPGIPERGSAIAAALHALWQARRLGRLGPRDWDLAVFHGVPHPFVQRVAREIARGARIAYDCADDKPATFADLHGARAGERIGRWERRIVEKADALTAINDANLRRLDPEGRLPATVVPNGVDTRLFRFRPRRIPSTGPIRAAFAGTVNDRIDVDRIGRILGNEPRLEVHVYGADHPCLDPIRNHPRLRIHGLVPYRDLPGKLDACDLGLVPYRDLPSIRASSPLKSLQYLSLGLPVAAFPYPGLPELGGMVHPLAGDRLPPESADWTVPDDSLARENGWDRMAELFLEAAMR